MLFTPCTPPPPKCLRPCKGMLLNAHNFNAETSSAKNVYSSDAAGRGKFDQEVQL